ncbi:protein wech [Tetranychus urticae]|uniref:Brain tumor protein n=1 Tax=Tetranychus urticae TaxID=32264 RepID=T1KLS6_TETUR|nr:protein wech [Tetranychus urticae]
MEDDKNKSDFVNEYQMMVQELQNELDDLSLNKDAVEQAINEQYHSIKAALDKCYKQMLDDLSKVHREKRMQLWGQIDRCEKISEKMSNQRDGLIEEFVEGTGGTNGDGSKDSDLLTSSQSSPPSSFLDFTHESSPVGVNLKNLKLTNGKGDQIIFNPVDIASVESMLIPNLFGTLKTQEIDESDLEENPCFSFPADVTTQTARSLPTLAPQSYNNSVNVTSPVSLPRSGPIAVPNNSNSNHLDLNDYITRVNLTKLAFYNENPAAAAAVIQPRLSSISSSISNSPSPQPLISNSFVPYDNSGLAMSETTVNSLNDLAKFPSPNGIETQPSTNFPFRASSAPSAGPLVSPVPPPSVPAVSSLNPVALGTNKCNVMQIRCKFGQLGSAIGNFSSPHGFCLGVDEDIIIADTNNHRICIFDKNGEYRFHFGVQGKEEGQLWYPRKVAMIRTPFLGITAPRYVVCDRGTERSRMQIFTSKGQFIRKIGVRYIDIVAGLAITPKGLIVAVDSVSPTVFVIAESGDLLRWFDCSPYMREPSDIAVNGKEFYVCDFKGSCVVVFGEDGKFKRRIGKEKITDYPNGIDFSDAGDILVGDSHGNRFHVVVFDKAGNFLSEFECPYVKVSRCCGLKITSEGYIVTLAKNNHHVLVLNTLYVT